VQNYKEHKSKQQEDVKCRKLKAINLEQCKTLILKLE